MEGTYIKAQKPVEKQACPICGLVQDEFRSMFGLKPDEPTGCELHEPQECPACAKDLR